MSHRAFTILRFALIGSSFAVMLSALLISVFYPRSLLGLKGFLTGLMFTLISAYLFVNAACGIEHKQMWSKGSPVTLEDSGRWFYWFHLPVNLLFGVVTGAFAVLAWSGAMKVGL